MNSATGMEALHNRQRYGKLVCEANEVGIRQSAGRVVIVYELTSAEADLQRWEKSTSACGRLEAVMVDLLATNEMVHRLGYSNTANFLNAFMRWFGRSPGQFRQQR